jgi:hypothetical protein
LLPLSTRFPAIRPKTITKSRRSYNVFSKAEHHINFPSLALTRAKRNPRRADFIARGQQNGAVNAEGVHSCVQARSGAACGVRSEPGVGSARSWIGRIDPVQWVKVHHAGTLKGASSKAQVSAEQMEICRLCAELARATLKRDILRPSDEDLRRWG